MALTFKGHVYRTPLEFIQHHPMYTQNKYHGRCCFCDQPVDALKGHIVGINGKIRIAHLPVIGQCSAVGEHVR